MGFKQSSLELFGGLGQTLKIWPLIIILGVIVEGENLIISFYDCCRVEDKQPNFAKPATSSTILKTKTKLAHVFTFHNLANRSN